MTVPAAPDAPANIPAVCAIVVNWNGWRDTITCLNSLLAQDMPLRVLVCDNGSTDDSVPQLLAWFAARLAGWQSATAVSVLGWRAPPGAVKAGPDTVQLLRLGTNLGYAGGINSGIGWAQAHWGSRRFWLLNNDVDAQPGALRALLGAHAAVPNAGICGSVLMEWERPGEVQAVAGTFHRALGVGGHLQTMPPGDVYLDADYPVGASLYVVQDYLDRVGPMDERYFLYCEEMDWAERGRRQGLRPVVALRSRLRHKEGASTGSRGGVRHKSLLSERYGVINRLRITRKFWPRWLPVVWLSLFAVAGDRLVHGEFARAGLVLRLMLSPSHWRR